MKSESGRSNLPTIDENSQSGRIGESLLQLAVERLGHLYIPNSKSDYGVDGIMEFSNATRNGVSQASGRQIGIQAKRGLSVAKPTRYGRTMYCTEAHGNYWLAHSLPIIVVHCDPETDRLRWVHINSQTLRKTDSGFAVDLPEPSDFRHAIPELVLIANLEPDKQVDPRIYENLEIAFSAENGILGADESLGLAALATCRAALRGDPYRIKVELFEEPDLIASIDAVRDQESPTFEDQRSAIIRQDVLARLKRFTKSLERTLLILLTTPSLAEQFGYRHDLMALAIRRCTTLHLPRQADDVALDAWPGLGRHEPTVRFDISREAMEEFYASDQANRYYIRAGDAGQVMVSSLPDDSIATRFLPAFAKRLVELADKQGISDTESAATYGEFPSLWLIGLA